MCDGFTVVLYHGLLRCMLIIALLLLSADLISSCSSQQRQFRRSPTAAFIAITTRNGEAWNNGNRNRIVALHPPSSTKVDVIKPLASHTALRSFQDDTSLIESNTLPSFQHLEDDNTTDATSALQRAFEVTSIMSSTILPILTTLSDYNWSTTSETSDVWEAFWSHSHSFAQTSNTNITSVSNAQRVASALEKLGPTYVKFGQALGSRPDVIPKALAEALSKLQDDMKPFDSQLAKEIVRRELYERTSAPTGSSQGSRIRAKDLECLLSNLTSPVAAASIGQVYKAYLPVLGEVAVKVQRPGIREVVRKDTKLLLAVANFLESLPAFTTNNHANNNSNTRNRLINTKLVSATQEFMSRIFEELDYRNEAKNCIEFARLYSHESSDHQSTSKVRVVVPKVYIDWCTENVLVMEWIDGTKLTDVQTSTNINNFNNNNNNISVKENLNLVKLAIDSTLSQLLVTGVLHADPHAGNLLKVKMKNGLLALGYLDFGLLSTIPSQVRDALVCSVVLQVFSRDIDAVASLFGELQLIPQHVLDDPKERRALAQALEVTFENSLLYPKLLSSNSKDTQIPELKFDKLLDSLSRLVPRFQFDLPPYFINNARALSTLEGIAKSLDPSFNVLEIMYPYALNMLILNPSGSPVVASTVQSLIRSKRSGRIDRGKIRQLLRDSALISGRSKRRVALDIVKTKEGRKLAISILGEELHTKLSGRDVSGNADWRQKRRRKRWFYLGL